MIPATCKQTELFVYAPPADIPAIKLEPSWLPIVGTPQEIHGEVIGYVEGKTVVVDRTQG